MNRLFLYSGLLFILILIFDAYDRDYNAPEIENYESQEYKESNTVGQPPAESALDTTEPQSTVKAKRVIETLEGDKLLIKYDVLTGEIVEAL